MKGCRWCRKALVLILVSYFRVVTSMCALRWDYSASDLGTLLRVMGALPSLAPENPEPLGYGLEVVDTFFVQTTAS